jgi:hypothetical protein
MQLLDERKMEIASRPKESLPKTAGPLVDPMGSLRGFFFKKK